MKQVLISEVKFNKCLKWRDLFDSEGELIRTMFKCKVRGSNPYQLVKGYEYIESFQRYYAKNGRLTEKQMVQLKRLAKAIYEHINTK